MNNLGTYGRWAFAEFTQIYAMEAEFAEKVEAEFNRVINSVTSRADATALDASQKLARLGGTEPSLAPIPRRRSEPD